MKRPLRVACEARRVPQGGCPRAGAPWRVLQGGCALAACPAHWRAAPRPSIPVTTLDSVGSAMPRPPITLLVTLTGRDRPGVTSRLFTDLAAHQLTVLDVEQVVIRGYLVLGVLLACADAPDLTAIHRQVTSLAEDLGMNAEITMGSGEHERQRGRLHVTVLGNP